MLSVIGVDTNMNDLILRGGDSHFLSMIIVACHFNVEHSKICQMLVHNINIQTRKIKVLVVILSIHKPDTIIFHFMSYLVLKFTSPFFTFVTPWTFVGLFTPGIAKFDKLCTVAQL